ncbi:MAG: hypothetical protein ACF8OB_12620, partial [Phycisphaeraceae bacterium JB051]
MKSESSTFQSQRFMFILLCAITVCLLVSTLPMAAQVRQEPAGNTLADQQTVPPPPIAGDMPVPILPPG